MRVNSHKCNVSRETERVQMKMQHLVKQNDNNI